MSQRLEFIIFNANQNEFDYQFKRIDIDHSFIIKILMKLRNYIFGQFDRLESGINMNVEYLPIQQFIGVEIIMSFLGKFLILFFVAHCK